MKKSIFTISCITIGLLFSLQSYADNIKNLDTIKQDLIHYHDSGLYDKNINTVISQAQKYLATRLASPKSTDKLAIVLDIDETSLSNYHDMVNMSFGGTFKEIVDAEGKGTDTVIQPTLALYRYAKAHHVAVFFITGRTENYRAGTIKNLNQVGYHDWDGLTLKAENYHQKTAATYKIAERQAITKQGYDIVLNIGDQKSDLVGGYADKTFRLPNPYYLVP